MVEAKIRELTLDRCEQVAERTTAFHFTRPADFAFRAGQAIDLVLGAGEGGEARHAFSIVSAPFERELVVATRMRDSAFKRALSALPPGAAVGYDGPFGSLTLHRAVARAAVFIAGGIGITPFVSILRQAAHDRDPRPMALLYSNRRPEDAAFLDELQRLEKANENFRLVATMTGMADSSRPWEGARQPVDANLVAAAAAGLPSPVYYVAGPPGLVAGIRSVLAGAGVDDDDIRAEEFFGY